MLEASAMPVLVLLVLVATLAGLFGWHNSHTRKRRLGTEDRVTSEDSGRVSSETKKAVLDFVEAAALRLSEAPKTAHLERDVEPRWVRGSDGHFREFPKRNRRSSPVLTDQGLRELPGYDACVRQLKTDSVVGPHLDRLVGTAVGASRIDADQVLRSVIYRMVDEEGGLAFTTQQFNGEWHALVNFFTAERFVAKTVGPIPNLSVPLFPLRLNDNLVLDRLTDDEVTRCYQVGVLRPQTLRFPLIEGSLAVGVRNTTFLPKLIRTGDEEHGHEDLGNEGSFGERPFLRGDLVLDDVLSALRLFKHTRVRTAGHASWTDDAWLMSGTHYQALGKWPWGNYDLSATEVQPFLDLWHLLEHGAARLAFSVHRFNLAFDRALLADRIVDLIVAAEALFLGDLGTKDRGELRFRFALRAAKFIEHPDYKELEVFRFMRRAYDARSAIVHGGTPDDARLPDNQPAELRRFADEIEEFVRRGLRKGLAVEADGKRLNQADYWDGLLFSES